MAAPASLLLFGRDERLLETRRLVLEASGYQTSVAEELFQVEQLLAAQRIALLILCHSLSTVELRQAASLAAAQPHPPRCLSLVAADVTPDLDHPIAVMSSREGPARMLATIAHLIQQPTAPANPSGVS